MPDPEGGVEIRAWKARVLTTIEQMLVYQKTMFERNFA